MTQQIHHARIGDRVRFVPDPGSAIDHALFPGTSHRRGMSAERYRALGPSDVHQIAHEGETYNIDPDGSFTVPEHVAAHLTRMPEWHEGPNPFAGEAA